MSAAIVDCIVALFREQGDAAYLGEPVSQTEHALQAAHLAELAGAPVTLVAAALLHDVGHLLHDEGDDAADRGLDTVHEELAARWLSTWFVPAVTEPIRLHVASKRYLCAVEPAYLARLSPASVRSLRLQGGPFSTTAAAGFEALPFAAEAVRLRRYDDLAKLERAPTPDLDHFRGALESGLSTTREP